MLDISRFTTTRIEWFWVCIVCYYVFVSYFYTQAPVLRAHRPNVQKVKIF